MFSWDARKALQNYRKDGVPFEEAATVFSDPEGLDWEDLEHADAERRWKRLGLSAKGRVLMVVYTLRRLRDDIEAIRIISARHASRREREAYAG
ncbi:MAG TPA: BrnT family toxin [Terriglobia bacterium]|nr:BrnT family toxin [Terriglobia bacterium]